jgi:hypothetical protein
MQVICLKDEPFYALINEVVVRLKEKQGKTPDKWISSEEAMQKLRISSKTTYRSSETKESRHIAFHYLAKS